MTGGDLKGNPRRSDLAALKAEELNARLLQYAQDPKLAEFIPAVVDEGASLNHTVDGRNMLHMAAQSGNAAAVEKLIDLGIDKDSRATTELLEGWTAAHFAASNDHLSVLKVLHEKTANMFAQDELGETPLHGTTVTGAPRAAEFLSQIATKEQVNLRNADGDTALSIADTADKSDRMNADLGLPLADATARRSKAALAIMTSGKVDWKTEPSVQQLPGEDIDAYFTRKIRDLPPDEQARHTSLALESKEQAKGIAEAFKAGEKAGMSREEIIEEITKAMKKDRTKDILPVKKRGFELQ